MKIMKIMKATEATEEMKVTETTSTTKNEIVSLFLMIREARNGKLSREALVKYVMLRVKMKSLFDEYEKVRQEISEQTKPDDWKEGESSERWDKAFRPVMEKWLIEPSGIDTKIFTDEDCADFILSNPDKDGTYIDTMTHYFKI